MAQIGLQDEKKRGRSRTRLMAGRKREIRGKSMMDEYKNSKHLIQAHRVRGGEEDGKRRKSLVSDGLYKETAERLTHKQRRTTVKRVS